MFIEFHNINHISRLRYLCYFKDKTNNIMIKYDGNIVKKICTVVKAHT